MIEAEKVLYTGKTHTTGGRDGAARSDDGRLDVRLSTPGSSRPGTNQAALRCRLVGVLHRRNRAGGRPAQGCASDLAVDTEVDLRNRNGGYFLQARLNVSLPGVDADVARQLVDAAHQTCPYSKATRGNIDVTINLV